MTETRCDLHVHSRYSTDSGNYALRRARLGESYTDPERLYRVCRARRMDFVTICDHNTVEGALRIAHLPDTFLSVEVTTRFAEDDVPLHVLVWNLTEEDHRDLQPYRPSVVELVGVPARARSRSRARPPALPDGAAPHAEPCRAAAAPLLRVGGPERCAAGGDEPARLPARSCGLARLSREAGRAARPRACGRRRCGSQRRIRRSRRPRHRDHLDAGPRRHGRRLPRLGHGGLRRPRRRSRVGREARARDRRPRGQRLPGGRPPAPRRARRDRCGALRRRRGRCCVPPRGDPRSEPAALARPRVEGAGRRGRPGSARRARGAADLRRGGDRAPAPYLGTARHQADARSGLDEIEAAFFGESEEAHGPRGDGLHRHVRRDERRGRNDAAAGRRGAAAPPRPCGGRARGRIRARA